MKTLLDNKTECTIIWDNGCFARIIANKKAMIVFSYRLTTAYCYQF